MGGGSRKGQETGTSGSSHNDRSMKCHCECGWNGLARSEKHMRILSRLHGKNCQYNPLIPQQMELVRTISQRCPDMNSR